MTLLGGTFVFPDSTIIALAGSDFGATLDEKPVELWRRYEVRRGTGASSWGRRVRGRGVIYVFWGGIEVELFLGSASTHVLSGLGGHEGRALRKGDVLKIGTHRWKMMVRGPRRFENASGWYRIEWLDVLAPRKLLRVTDGPQSDWFSEPAKKLFYESTFQVTEESNRMGIRLKGAQRFRRRPVEK